MTAIGTMIISLSGTHTFAKPSIVRYIITDLINLLSISLSFFMLVQRYVTTLLTFVKVFVFK